MVILARHNFSSPESFDDWQGWYRFQPSTAGNKDATGIWSVLTDGLNVYFTGVAIAAEMFSGWLHVAYTFNLNTQTLSTFYDGSLVATETKSGWVAFGGNGRCSFTIVFPFLFNILLHLNYNVYFWA